MANSFTLTCYQYADLPSTVITWEDSGGNPVNLTGYTADMDVKDNQGNIIVTLSTSNGRITLGGVLGTITLSLPNTVTSTLTPGFYVFDIMLTSGTGFKTRIPEIPGTFNLVAGVTPS